MDPSSSSLSSHATGLTTSMSFSAESSMECKSWTPWKVSAPATEQPALNASLPTAVSSEETNQTNISSSQVTKMKLSFKDLAR